MGTLGQPVPCQGEVNARAYWTHTLAPFVLSLAGELALLQPTDPASFALAVCAGAGSWTGECRVSGEVDGDAEGAAEAYMTGVGQPLVEALTTAILAAGDPLPPYPGTAGVAALGAEGAIARAASEGVAALGGAQRAGGPFAVREYALKSATWYLQAGLSAAAREEAAHGGVGVELEPAVPRAELEAYIASRQGAGGAAGGGTQ